MAFRQLALAGLITVSWFALASAEELPKLKAGLWEQKLLSGDGGAPDAVYKQCMDGKIDIESVMKATGGICDIKWKRVAADRIETESNCNTGMMTAKGKGVVTGDFNSQLRIETSATISLNNLPAGAPKMPIPEKPMTMVIEARWIGPCASDQKPGDIIGPDGQVMTMPKFQPTPQ